MVVGPIRRWIERATADSLARDGRLYALLSLTVAGVLGATVVSPALPGMARTYGLSDARVTLVVTAFFLPAALALPVVGALADARGRRPVGLGSLAAYGVAGLAIAVAPTFEVVLALRAVQGVAFPGLIPLSITLVGDLYDGRTATRVHGFRSGINGLTGVVFPAIAGVVAALSWRYPFVLYGVALLALPLCYVALPEPAGTAGGGRSARLLDGSRIAAAVREVGDGLSGPVLAVIGATCVVFLVRYALLSYVPLFAVARLGTGEAVGGFAVAAMGVGRFVGGPLAGRVVGALGRRRTFLGTQLLLASGACALAVASGTATLLAAVLVASLGEGLFNPVANDFVTTSAPAAVRARVVSVMEVGKTTSIAAAPVAFGIVLGTSSYRVAFLVGGAVVGLVGLTVALGYGAGAMSAVGRAGSAE